MIDAGFADFGARWRPILDTFAEQGVRFALEVHPTEIAFDLPSAARTLDAVGGHAAFGFNFDPSHFAYQGVDYIAFIERFGDRIFHAHMKDVWWSDAAAPERRVRRAPRVRPPRPLLGLPIASAADASTSKG